MMTNRGRALVINNTNFIQEQLNKRDNHNHGNVLPSNNDNNINDNTNNKRKYTKTAIICQNSACNVIKDISDDNWTRCSNEKLKYIDFVLKKVVMHYSASI